LGTRLLLYGMQLFFCIFQVYNNLQQLNHSAEIIINKHGTISGIYFLLFKLL
jgi:hypothetical protein